MKSVRFYVQTAINRQRKCPESPYCKYIENLLMFFFWLNAQAKSPKQTILYQFKWDTALWKSPKCPQYMQRTWWLTVAAQHTELRALFITIFMWSPNENWSQNKRLYGTLCRSRHYPTMYFLKGTCLNLDTFYRCTTFHKHSRQQWFREDCQISERWDKVTP